MEGNCFRFDLNGMDDPLTTTVGWVELSLADCEISSCGIYFALMNSLLHHRFSCHLADNHLLHPKSKPPAYAFPNMGYKLFCTINVQINLSSQNSLLMIPKWQKFGGVSLQNSAP